MSVSVRRVAKAGAIALVAGIAGALLIASPAAADTYTVLNGDDSGPGSLEQAILDSNASGATDDFIDFAPGLADILLTTDLPPITDTVQISGPVSDELLITSPNSTLTITGPGIEVEISGLLFDTENNAAANGITATDSDLTLIDVHTLGYPGYGVSVTNGDLSTQSSSFDENTDVGVYYTSGAADDKISMESTTLNRNTYGLYANLAAGTESAYFDVEAHLNDDAGLYFLPANDSDIVVQYSYLHENGGPGISAFLEDSDIIVQDTVIDRNGVAGSGGGVYLDLDDSSATLAGNDITGNSATNGGGIYVPEMTGTTSLSITGNDITGNTATSGDGGGIHLGQVLPNGLASSIYLYLNYVANNEASGDGGGLYVHDMGLGVPYPGGLEIVRSTFDNNRALGGNGGGIDINSFSKDTVPGAPLITIIDSTISRNTAFDVGGGLNLYKGSSTIDEAPRVEVINSTFSGNTAAVGGAMFIDGPDGSDNQILFHIQTSTIVGNTATASAGGLYVEDDETLLQVYNSILANNALSDLVFTPEAGMMQAEYSNIRTPDASALAQIQSSIGNVVGLDPNLGALAYNGGPTETHLPNPGSPVFNTANPAFAPPPALDQRGEPRVLEGRLDMGAVESPYVAAPLPPTGSGVSGELVGFALLLLLGGAVIAVTRRRADAR